jgi:hypothetical protein
LPPRAEDVLQLQIQDDRLRRQLEDRATANRAREIAQAKNIDDQRAAAAVQQSQIEQAGLNERARLNREGMIESARLMSGADQDKLRLEADLRAKELAADPLRQEAMETLNARKALVGGIHDEVVQSEVNKPSSGVAYVTKAVPAAPASTYVGPSKNFNTDVASIADKVAAINRQNGAEYDMPGGGNYLPGASIRDASGILRQIAAPGQYKEPVVSTTPPVMVPPTWDRSMTPEIGAGRGNYPPGVSPAPVSVTPDAVRNMMVQEATSKPVVASTASAPAIDDEQALINKYAIGKLPLPRSIQRKQKVEDFTTEEDVRALANRAQDPERAFAAAQRLKQPFEFTPTELASIKTKNRELNAANKTSEYGASLSGVMDSLKPNIDEINKYIENIGISTNPDSYDVESGLRALYSKLVNAAGSKLDNPEDLQDFKTEVLNAMLKKGNSELGAAIPSWLFEKRTPRQDKMTKMIYRAAGYKL